MSFDGIRNQPRQIQRPMCRQAFRPGQWDGVKVGARHITNIQNNFYGADVSYRGWGDAWAGYDYGQAVPQDSGKMGVLGWIGLGLGALGGILGGIFGGKKETAAPEEKGAPEADAALKAQLAQQQQTLDDLQAQIDALKNGKKPDDVEGGDPPTEEVEGGDPPAEAPKEDATNPIDEFDWGADGFTTDCRDVDANGKDKTPPIMGRVKVTEAGGDKKAPKTFTITTASGNTYTFTKVESQTGDKIQYKCTQETTRNGAKTEFTKGNVYTCEMNGEKPVLRQHEGDAGSGLRVGLE